MNNHFITRTNHSASNRSNKTTSISRSKKIATVAAVLGSSLFALSLPNASALPKTDPDTGTVRPVPTTRPRPTTTKPRINPSVLAGSPRFKAELVSFRVPDESGVDILGSDEPVFVLSAPDGNGGVRTVRSKEYSDVDSGDTEVFSPVICASVNCSAGGQGFTFQVNLLEIDQGDPAVIAGKVHNAIKGAGWLAAIATLLGTGDTTTSAQALAAADKVDKTAAQTLVGLLGDDLLGSETVAYTLPELLAAMPAVGNTYQEEIKLGKEEGDLVDYFDGGADYRVMVRLTRVADAQPVLSVAG